MFILAAALIALESFTLAAALAIPHFDCDDFFHAPSDPPFQNPRPAEERYELICRDVSPEESWVLSGGFSGWEPQPELDFTGLAFLYVPTAVRIERLRHRERERFGSRIEAGGDMCEIHEEFLVWVARYDLGGIEGKTLARHEVYLKEQHCTVWEFRGEPALDEILQRVLQSVREEEL